MRKKKNPYKKMYSSLVLPKWYNEDGDDYWMYADGVYIDKQGHAVRIYMQENTRKGSIEFLTLLEFIHAGTVYPVEYQETFSDRGLMIACSNLIRNTLNTA